MTDTLTKPSFNAGYLELIGLSENAPSSSFYSTSDYSKLSSLGPSLPKSKAPIPRFKTNKNSTTGSTLTLAFKSIKPPFKFSTQLTNVPDNYALYRIKNDLIESLPLLKDANVTAADLKLLVKGKVIQDTAILSTLAANDTSEISFMCMVSAPKPVTELAPVELPAADQDPTADVPATTLAATTWKKIELVLEEDLGKQEAVAVLQKLQSSFNS